MRTITVEEHLATAEVMSEWADVEPEHHDESTDLYQGPLGPPLLEVGEQRLAWMDEMGVDVQVLSLTTPGVQGLSADAAVALARDANDCIASAISHYPGRFQGLATLPTPAPEAAATELRRAVQELGLQGGMTFGRTRSRNIDDPANEPIFAAASDLGVPLFLHPQMPPAAVRNSLYSGLPERVDFALSAAGLGWHYEAGVQFVRMVLSGVFDRYPDLQVILGHWGDLVIFYLEELAVIPRLAQTDQAPISHYAARHVYVVPSGTLSHRYLGWAVEVVGIDRILFGLDYPFVPRRIGDVSAFLRQSPLSPSDRERLASRNWEELTARARR